MRCLYAVALVLSLLPASVLAADPGVVKLHYELHAAGIDVAAVDVTLLVDARSYEVTVETRTNGLAGFFVGGHQTETVRGTWRDGRASPQHYTLASNWRGNEKRTDIDYEQGTPLIRQLLPAVEPERIPVAPAMRQGSIDTLSALAQMIHNVALTGHCDSKARLFDGRRASDIQSRTLQQEEVAATSRSSFYGRALRCDFAAQALAGWTFTDGRAQDGRPLEGTAWLADLVPGAPPLPGRMAFGTRWFGDATLFLRGIEQTPETRIARP